MNARPWSLPGYQILSEIARGGQGVVFHAVHQASGQEVAIKGLLSADAKSRTRFQQEGRILSILKHPQLLQVFEVGVVEGRDYLVTELVRGLDLATHLERQGVPPFTFTAQVMARIARCLQYCHENGVVHRDLKPSNVVVDAATQRPVLIDFGLVKRDADKLDLGSLDGLSQLSQSGSLKGTPAFMAPEQVRAGQGADVGAHSDVYGLGATLYMLLCGQPPFAGSSAVAVMRKVTRKAPPKLASVNPLVPPDLARVAMACLAKAPADRPRSAAAVARALEKALGTQATAPPPLPSESRPKVILPAGAPRLNPGARIANFAVVSELGRGGMGVVYEARDVNGQRYALKTLLNEANETSLKRFEREGSALAQLNHPNVVRYAGSGREPCPWLAMEFVEGRDLRGVLESEGPLDSGDLAQLLAQAAEGLAHVHQAGLVHRDIKPDNLLVRSADRCVLLTDLGVARDLAISRMTADGAMVGTFAYMSPEQVTGEAGVGPPTDIWALGATLYRGLCGENPFVAPNELALAAHISEGKVTHPQELDPSIPLDLAAVSLACMQVEASARPTAGEVAEALRTRKLSEVFKPFAKPPGGGGGVPKLLVPTLGALVVVLLLTLVGLAWRKRSGSERAQAPPATAATPTSGVSTRTPPPKTRSFEDAPELRSPTLLRQDLATRIASCEQWLRDWSDHPDADRIKRIYVAAKLERGPTAHDLPPGNAFAWFTSRGILVSRDTMDRVVLERLGLDPRDYRNCSLTLFPYGSWDGQLLAQAPHMQLTAGGFQSDRASPALIVGYVGSEERNKHCLWVPGQGARWLWGSTGSPKTRRLATSHDGKYVAISFDAYVGVYRWKDVLATPEGSHPQSFGARLKAGEGLVQELAFAQDGTLVSVSHDDATIARWVVGPDGLEPVTQERSSPWPIMIAGNPKRPWLVEGLHLNRVLRIREARSGDPVSTLVAPRAKTLQERDAASSLLKSGDPGHSSPIEAGVFSPDGDRLYTVSAGPGQVSELRVWSTGPNPAEHGEWIAVVQRPPGVSNYRRMDLSPDGRTLLTVAEVRPQTYRIELWDVGETPAD